MADRPTRRQGRLRPADQLRPRRQGRPHLRADVSERPAAVFRGLVGTVPVVRAGRQGTGHGGQPERLHARHRRAGLLHRRGPGEEPAHPRRGAAASGPGTSRVASSSAGDSGRNRGQRGRLSVQDGTAIEAGSGLDLRGLGAGRRRLRWDAPAGHVAGDHGATHRRELFRSTRCIREIGHEVIEDVLPALRGPQPGRRRARGSTSFSPTNCSSAWRATSGTAALPPSSKSARATTCCRNCRRCSSTSARARRRSGWITAM